MYTFTKQDLSDAINATMARTKTKRQVEGVEFAAAWIAKFDGVSWSLKVDYLLTKSTNKDRSGRVYTLTLGEHPHCSCPATKPCKHLAVILEAANQLREALEALDYGVWYADQECCGGQGCSLCMVTVEPAVTLTRVALAPAIITMNMKTRCSHSRPHCDYPAGVRRPVSRRCAYQPEGGLTHGHQRSRPRGRYADLYHARHDRGHHPGSGALGRQPG